MGPLRPTVIVVAPAEVMEALRWLLDKKSTKFKWDGTDYARPDRGQLPDTEGLLFHEEPLKILLKIAPSRFPSHASLRDAFMLCDQKFNILPESACGRRHEANLA